MRADEMIAVGARRGTVQAGLDVMAEGGTAVDAAVCMALVAAVLEPTETSLGGSGFLLLDDPAVENPVSVEFGPRAPARAHPELAAFTRPGASGPLMSCVPGLVAGLGLAHHRFGTSPWERLVGPAIALAEDGFEVDEYLCLQILNNLDALSTDPGAARVFLRDGLPPIPQFAVRRDDRPPARLRQPDLASTLRTIAADGAHAFYVGGLGETIARGFAGQGGCLGLEDLARYRAIVCRPTSIRYRDWDLYGPSAPCGVSAVFGALERLTAVDPAALGSGKPDGLSHMASSLRAAFDERLRSEGDLTFVDAGHGTTHLGAIDNAGRLVTCTTTLGETFGSKFIAPETGVLFDSGLAWFDAGTGPNRIEGGKRPLVNMSPLLMRDRRGRRVGLGAAGGRRIISAVTQVAASIVDGNLTIDEAVARPRLDASEDLIRVGDRFPSETVAGLRERGYEVRTVAEQHAPFSYELARPAAVATAPDGSLTGAIHPFATGYVGGR